MEPPSLSIELRKLLLRLTLACFSRKLVKNKSVGLIVSLKNDRNGRGLSGRGFKNFVRTSCAIGTPLQEILDPGPHLPHRLENKAKPIANLNSNQRFRRSGPD